MPLNGGCERWSSVVHEVAQKKSLKCCKLFNHKQLRLITIKLTVTTVKGGRSRSNVWGKMGPTWGFIQSSIVLFGHLKRTGNTLTCVFKGERETSSLRTVMCGRREEENMSGGMNLLPCLLFPPRLVIFVFFYQSSGFSTADVECVKPRCGF